MSSSLKQYASLSSGQLVLEAEVARGGEGTVYHLAGKPDLLVKLYRKLPLPLNQEAKLRHLLRQGNAELSRVAAWPTDLVLGTDGRIAGIVMPRIHSTGKLATALNPQARLKSWPEADWPFLIRLALNLSRLVATCHKYGIVIGDLNESNILISADALAYLVDCDSVQVQEGTTLHRCLVGVPRYLAPELHGQSLDRVDRTPEQDAFSLAVLVFQLLMLGRHPFTGRYLGPGEVDEAGSVRQELYAFSAEVPSMQQPPGTLPVEIFGPEVKSMFERSFSKLRKGTTRPLPQEWVTSLLRLEKDLRPCAVNGAHAYHAGWTGCPWCQIEQGTGVRYFPFRMPGLSIQIPATDAEADIELPAALSSVDGINKLLSSRLLDESYHIRRPRKEQLAQLLTLLASVPVDIQPEMGTSFNAKVEALELGQRRAQLRNGQMIAVGIEIAMVIFYGMANTTTGAVVIGVIQFVALLAFIACEINLLRFPVEEYKKKFWAAKEACELWEREAAGCRRQNHSEAEAKAKSAIDAICIHMPQNYQDQTTQRVKDLQRVEREQKLEAHLKSIPIRAGVISGIGEKRVEQLRAYGIVSFSDISASRLSCISGFGDVLISTLMAAKWGAMAGFTYKPDPRIEQQVKLELQAKFQAMQQAQVSFALTAIRNYASHVVHIPKLSLELLASREELWRTRRQAEENYKAVVP